MSTQQHTSTAAPSSPARARSSGPMRLLHGYVVTQGATTKHKAWVAFYMLRLALADPQWRTRAWLWRAIRHDWTKYRWDEASGFARTIFDLKTVSYGTDEYRALLRKIKPSIERHYSRWSHHPEHHESYAAMPLIDRAEMICDWTAACRRHADGDIMRSIEHNQERFGYDDVERLRLTRWAELIA